jgi:hypothetical protein
MRKKPVPTGWGEFYALVNRSVLTDAVDADPLKAKGEFPDAIWWHDDDVISQGREYIRTLEANATKASGSNLTIATPNWNWQRCRIEHRRGNELLAVVPGLRDPLPLNPGLVFEGTAYMRAMEAAFKGIHAPMHNGEFVNTSTGAIAFTMFASSNDQVPTAEAWEAARLEVIEHAPRREGVNLALVTGLLETVSGASEEPPIKTAATSPALVDRIKKRLQDESAKVKKYPALMSNLLAVISLTPAKRKKQAQDTLSIAPHPDDIGKKKKNRMQVRVQLSPESRLEISPAKPSKQLGIALTYPLAFEARELTLDADNEHAGAIRAIAEEAVSAVAGMNPDLHRTMMGVIGAMQDQWKVAVNAENIHKWRGFSDSPNDKQRERYREQIDMMRGLSFDVLDTASPDETIVVPFIGAGVQVVETKGRALKQINFIMHDDSIVGMLNLRNAHQHQFFADRRLTSLTDDLAYGLGVYISRQWSARMTQHAVQGKRQHGHRLDTVLDKCPFDWRTPLRKEGKKWLVKRVEKALGELRQLGHFGNDGGATVAWNMDGSTDDFMASMVDFGDPPAHIQEAHIVRNSRRIEGAITKRKRLDEQGEPAKRKRKSQGTN